MSAPARAKIAAVMVALPELLHGHIVMLGLAQQHQTPQPKPRLKGDKTASCR
jgi:hypothetical protein